MRGNDGLAEAEQAAARIDETELALTPRLIAEAFQNSSLSETCALDELSDVANTKIKTGAFAVLRIVRDVEMNFAAETGEFQNQIVSGAEDFRIAENGFVKANRVIEIQAGEHGDDSIKFHQG